MIGRLLMNDGGRHVHVPCDLLVRLEGEGSERWSAVASRAYALAAEVTGAAPAGLVGVIVTRGRPGSTVYTVRVLLENIEQARDTKRLLEDLIPRVLGG